MCLDKVTWAARTDEELKSARSKRGSIDGYVWRRVGAVDKTTGKNRVASVCYHDGKERRQFAARFAPMETEETYQLRKWYRSKQVKVMSGEGATTKSYMLQCDPFPSAAVLEEWGQCGYWSGFHMFPTRQAAWRLLGAMTWEDVVLCPCYGKVVLADGEQCEARVLVVEQLYLSWWSSFVTSLHGIDGFVGFDIANELP